MTTHNDITLAMPARVRAALDYLEHCRWVTDQCDVTMPARTLSPLEKSVSDAALRVLSSYFLGEMDYGDAPPCRVPHSNEDDVDGARETVPTE